MSKKIEIDDYYVDPDRYIAAWENRGSTSILNDALSYAERHWEVFPGHSSGEKKSHKSAKHSNGRKWGKTTDPDEIRRDFQRWIDANIGIATGSESGIFVVEADTKEGHAVDGIASLTQLEAERGKLPDTLMAASPSGSLHHYFKWPSNAVIRNSTSKIAPGVDVRGENGMVIAPPSLRPGKGYYRWINEGTPVADAPQWLIDLATADDIEKQPPLPDWLRDLAKGCMGKGASSDAADLPPPIDIGKIKAALAAVPPTITRIQWNSIGCGLLKELGDASGLELFNEWSSTNKDLYKGRAQVEGQWRSFVAKDGYGYTIKSLFWIADQTDPGWRSRYAKMDAAPKEAKLSSRNYELVRASDVIARAKKWLWQGHLLCGAQELLTGVPGLAKSQLQCSLVACATTGSKWPDGSQNGICVKVIMVTAEDTLDQEVVPRLIAAGADLNSVFFLKAIKKDNSSSRMFLLSEDVNTLEQIIRDVGNVGLVTIDPITAFMGKVDSHQVAVVRSQLGPLKDLAERTEVGFSTITHPAKNAGPRAIDHFIGSQAFIAAGRIGHLCIEEVDEDNKPTGRILFTNPKNNPSPKMPTLAYRIEQTTIGQDPATREIIVAPRVVWDATPVQMTADQAIAATTGKKKEPQAVNNAVNFLRHELAGGPKPVKEIEAAAKEAGLSWSTVRRAQDELKIVPKKEGLGPWMWGLPEEVF